MKLKEFDKYKHRESNPLNYQEIYKFPNGYGASVIQGSTSFGLELAVIQFPIKGLDTWEFAYDTPITDDVLGYLDEKSLEDALNKIFNLPKVKHKKSGAADKRHICDISTIKGKCSLCGEEIELKNTELNTWDNIAKFHASCRTCTTEAQYEIALDNLARLFEDRNKKE